MMRISKLHSFFIVIRLSRKRLIIIVNIVGIVVIIIITRLGCGWNVKLRYIIID